MAARTQKPTQAPAVRPGRRTRAPRCGDGPSRDGEPRGGVRLPTVPATARASPGAQHRARPPRYATLGTPGPCRNSAATSAALIAVSFSPQTDRALRDAALSVAEARRQRSDAIVAAHRDGAAIRDIATAVGMDAFAVRDVLAQAGELQALQPKETARRAHVDERAARADTVARARSANPARRLDNATREAWRSSFAGCWQLRR